MPDREKVIKGLENCIKGFDCPEECPYLMDCNDLAKPMFVDLAKDTLALLKEHGWIPITERLPKDELLKALQYDRGQYQKGYADRDKEIVRCKDCKYYDHFNGCMSWHDVNSNNDNWYCADGERKEGR